MTCIPLYEQICRNDAAIRGNSMMIRRWLGDNPCFLLLTADLFGVLRKYAVYCLSVAPLAQRLEQRPFKSWVVGSNPDVYKRQGNPQRDENHPSGVLDTFSDSAANQSDGNHSECGLERHIDADRVIVGVQRSRREDAAVGNHGILQQETRGRITEDTADRSACVGDGPAPQLSLIHI